MSSDGEEIDLHQFDDEELNKFEGSEVEEHDAKRRSRKRKLAETAVGPLNVYESLGESELEEENARKRKFRRLGVDARRDITGYSQLIRTLETDHVQGVGAHIVNLHRTLVAEPLNSSDKPLLENGGRKTRANNNKSTGEGAPPNLKAAWPLQPSAIQNPRFSLLDEVRSITQRHIATQPNQHPLSTVARDRFPGSNDPNGLHPHLPEVTVNALALRTKALLDQIFDLLRDYRPATAPSSQLRVAPMNWEQVLDILAERNVVDPTVLERTQAKLENIFGPRKFNPFRKTSRLETGSAETGSSSVQFAAPTPSLDYLSHLQDNLVFLDNTQQIQKRLQAKRDAQQLLLKLKKKHMSGSDATESSSEASDDDASPKPEGPDSLAPAIPGPTRISASPSHSLNPEDTSNTVESRFLPEEKDENAAGSPMAGPASHTASIVDTSPSKIVKGWAVHVPEGDSEESSDEKDDEAVPHEELDELAGDLGSPERQTANDDTKVSMPHQASPETHSDPLFGGDVSSESGSSESSDEAMEQSDEGDKPSDEDVSDIGSDHVQSDEDEELDQVSDQEMVAPDQASPSDSNSDSNVDSEEDSEVGEGEADGRVLVNSQNGLPEEEYTDDSDEEEADEEDSQDKGSDQDDEDNAAQPDHSTRPVPTQTMLSGTVHSEIQEDDEEESESDFSVDPDVQASSPRISTAADGEDEREEEEDSAQEDGAGTTRYPVKSEHRDEASSDSPSGSESGSDVDSDDESETGEEDEAREEPTSADKVMSRHHRYHKDETMDDSEEEDLSDADSQNEGNGEDVPAKSLSSEAPAKGMAHNGTDDDTNSDEELSDSDVSVDQNVQASPAHIMTAIGGEDELKEEETMQTDAGRGADDDLDDAISEAEDDLVPHRSWGKSQSSSASEHATGSEDEEEVEEDSAQEGVEGEESASDMEEVEGSD
ncbi:hypothetical protein FRB90_004219 [Tulasnella sp. 427]|nr:hypothetical protein FRB90_004219 [Tulasnella sp. 427]